MPDRIVVARMAGFATDIAARQETVSALQDQQRKLEAKRIAAREQLDREMGDLAQVRATVSELRARVENLKRREREFTAEIVMREARYGVLADDIAEAERAYADRQAILESILRKTREHDPGALPGDGNTALRADDPRPIAELRKPPIVLSDLRNWPERGMETEAEALHRVSGHLKALGLSYPRRVIHAFHTAMKVNETTQWRCWHGISGTGKSRLPRRYAEEMGMGFLQVPDPAPVGQPAGPDEVLQLHREPLPPNGHGARFTTWTRSMGRRTVPTCRIACF